MTCWRDGRTAVRRVRSTDIKRAARAESRSLRSHLTTSGDMPTEAAELTVIEVASQPGRTVSDTISPGQLSSG